MTSCQVSLKPKIGPVTAQTTMTATASRKVTGRPVSQAVACENQLNHSWIFLPHEGDALLRIAHTLCATILFAGHEMTSVKKFRN